MKYDKNMYYDLLRCLGYASTSFDQWIHSITADDLDDILSHDDADMNDVMIDLSNDESVPADVREFCRANRDNVSVFIIESISGQFDIDSPVFDADCGNVWQNAEPEILQFAACLTHDAEPEILQTRQGKSYTSMYQYLHDDAVNSFHRLSQFDYSVYLTKDGTLMRDVTYVRLTDDYDSVFDDNSINIDRVNDLDSYDYSISFDHGTETWLSIRDAIWYLDTLEDEDMDITMTLTIDYPQKEWSGDYTDSIDNIKRLLESWKD